jgi:hypothetical protein
MEIDVSITEDLLRRMHDYSQRYGEPLDRLLSNALREYLDRRNVPEDDEVTAKLNEFYSKEQASQDQVIIQMAALSLPNDEW